MVDAMAVLGAAAAAKLAGDRIVRDFVAYIRETGSSVSSTAAQAYATSSSYRKHSARRPRKTRLSRRMKPSTSGLGRRPGSSRLSKKVSTMTDAELEAELDSRRHRRAREREAYSRALRSDKLAALESELDSLRREIGRLDPPTPGMVPRQPAGTPPNARWEALPRSRRPPSAHGPSLQGLAHSAAPVATAPGAPPAPRMGGAPPPPPPPPPPPMMAGDEDEGLAIDPEKQRREKLERQKRREAKKKEREQKQKKMTLADIIRAAGPDPASRLKPASVKPADAEQQEWERAKREREEREARQEKERIENEKLAKDGPKRAVENSPKRENGKDHASNQEELEKKDEEMKEVEKNDKEMEEAEKEQEEAQVAGSKDETKNNTTTTQYHEKDNSKIVGRDGSEKPGTVPDVSLQNGKNESAGAKSETSPVPGSPSNAGGGSGNISTEAMRKISAHNNGGVGDAGDTNAASSSVKNCLVAQNPGTDDATRSVNNAETPQARDDENLTPNAPLKTDIRASTKTMEDVGTGPRESKVETSS